MQKPYLFPQGSRLGADNLVLHATGRRHKVTSYPGPLSIKTVIRGEATWIVGGRELSVGPGSFLVLGGGEPYSMNLDSPVPLETCCVFFQRGFVEQIAVDATTPLASSLDDPNRSGPPLSFLSRLHSEHGTSIRSRVQSTARRCESQLQPSGAQEEFLVLARDVLELYERVRSQIARVPAAKASTRQELFKRLEVGREYFHARVEDGVSLEEAARAACLSRYHFHRSFTRVYGQTPHGYLTSLRLARAHALLQTGASAAETCVAVGFGNASSFARLFRSRYGVTPSSIRIRKIRTARIALSA
jgi:AraC family transcriptional regulator